jgi:hypothetical protein
MHLLAALVLAFGGAPSVSTDHGIPTVRWALGPHEYVSNVEIATGPNVYPHEQFLLGGSFRQTAYVVRLFPGGAPTTSITPLPYRNGVPLSNGTYYAHVHYIGGCSGWDECTSEAWSPVVRFTVSDSRPPRRAGPANGLSAHQVVLAGKLARVQLSAQYRVAVPDGCPAADPGPADADAAQRWGSAYCADYTQQGADLRVRVVHAGKVVYREQRAAYGPSWQTELFPAGFAGGCTTGRYRWTLTLLDPYFRPDVSVSGAFRARCG